MYLTSRDVLWIDVTLDKTIIKRTVFANAIVFVFVFAFLSDYPTKPGFPWTDAATLCQSSDKETAWGNCWSDKVECKEDFWGKINKKNHKKFINQKSPQHSHWSSSWFQRHLCHNFWNWFDVIQLKREFGTKNLLKFESRGFSLCVVGIFQSQKK